MPRDFTAVPAARSTAASLKAKQTVLIAGVLVAAILGPLAMVFVLSSRVDEKAIETRVKAEVQASVAAPDAVLAAASVVASSWANGLDTDVPHVGDFTLAGPSLGIRDVERITYANVPLADAGLPPQRFASAWTVYFRGVRTNGDLVRIGVPMAMTIATPDPALGASIPGVAVLLAPPAVEPTAPVLDANLLADGLSAPAGWAPDTEANTPGLRDVLNRWAKGYLADHLAEHGDVKLTPEEDSNLDGLNDVVDEGSPQLKERLRVLRSIDSNLGAYQGLGGFDLAQIQIIGGSPFAKTGANGQLDTSLLLVKVLIIARPAGTATPVTAAPTTNPLGQTGPAPTQSGVRVALDLLVETPANKVVAWGPAGTGTKLSPFQNHTANRAWQTPALKGS